MTPGPQGPRRVGRSAPGGVGVSRQTINAIETGRYLPSLPLAFLLAAHFGLRVDELFYPPEQESQP